MNQLLLFEYLHADADAFRQASASMRREGRAMLCALLEDGVAIDDHDVAVLLCEDAADDLQDLPAEVEIRRCRAADDTLHVLAAAAEHADLILPVAPESDGLLQSVAEVLQPRQESTLLPSLPMVRICSDKWQTRAHFHACDLPMPECRRVDRNVAGSSEPDHQPELVFKPRLGVGCDGIRRGRLPDGAAPADYVQQPMITGRSLSVALLGTPDGCRVLPVAEQEIEWIEHQPRYLGGTVPAGITEREQQQINSIAAHVARQMGHFKGYVGLDLLLSHADGTVYLNEINPRVCTSYIGYRRLLTESPLSIMIRTDVPVVCRDEQAVRFQP